MPGWLRGGLESGIGRLPRNETLKRGLYSLNIDERMRRYQNVFSILPGDAIDSLFRPGLLPEAYGLVPLSKAGLGWLLPSLLTFLGTTAYLRLRSR